MNINGLKVDAEAIGKGMYKIICDKGDEAVVAFGMIPVWAINSLKPMLKEKVKAESIKLGKDLDENEIGQVAAAIEHEVVLGIYAAASAAGKMVC